LLFMRFCTFGADTKFSLKVRIFRFFASLLWVIKLLSVFSVHYVISRKY
jgi:hypothetical protein